MAKKTIKADKTTRRSKIKGHDFEQVSMVCPIKSDKKEFMKEIEEFLFSDDAVDFVAMSVKDCDTNAGIEMMTGNDKQFTPTHIITLAHNIAGLLAVKTGFAQQAKEEGGDMKTKLVRCYAQIVIEFIGELYQATLDDLTDDDELREKLHKALQDADISKAMLYKSIEAKARIKMFEDGECCGDCCKKACDKLDKTREEVEGDDDDEEDDEDDKPKKTASQLWDELLGL